MVYYLYTAVCIDGFDALQPALLLAKCNGHFMHPKCVIDTFTAMGPKCPTCSTMYGTLLGEKLFFDIALETMCISFSLLHCCRAIPLRAFKGGQEAFHRCASKVSRRHEEEGGFGGTRSHLNQSSPLKTSAGRRSRLNLSSP